MDCQNITLESDLFNNATLKSINYVKFSILNLIK